MADTPPTACPSSVDLHKALRNIFESGEYHDLTIRSGDRTWKVHRAIICPQSKYFTKACSGGFKEAETREIVLDGDEPEAVERMLCWLYTRKYGEDSQPSIPEDMVMEARVYAIAEKYELDGLKNAAEAAFTDALEMYWETAQFVVVAEIVYTSTPDSDRGLRDVVKDFTCSKQRTLLVREDVPGLLNDLDGFSKDLVQELCETASSLAAPDYGIYCEVCCKRTLPAMNPGITVCGICDEVYRYPVVSEDYDD